MANQRKRMRQTREILRLRRECGLSYEKVAAALRMSKRTVQLYVERAEKAQLTWPLPETMDDEQLEQLLFRRFGFQRSVAVARSDQSGFPQ